MMEKLLLGDGGGEQDAAEVAAHQLSGHSYHLLRGCQKKNITLIFHILSLNGKTQLEEILYFCVYFEEADGSGSNIMSGVRSTYLNI